MLQHGQDAISHQQRRWTMNPIGVATIGTVPMTFPLRHQPGHRRHENFIADLQTVRLKAAGMIRSPFGTAAQPVPHIGLPNRLPVVSVRQLQKAVAGELAPGPAADFDFFREPLKQNMALMGQWAAAVRAGSQSGAWSQFVSDITEHFFKGSRMQRVMDALILSIDVLPANYRADALACLLADGEEGLAAAEEFWEYIGLDRIPDGDKERVRGLIRQYGIGA
ncbi:hypothetical protein [Pandoraea apista]|uniref:hypothetical protein n=1 Tax=Pandoraea apista TaxID=93218 RepID=UPI0011AFD44F|nr:hypothetical protein [Pandoraea apista]